MDECLSRKTTWNVIVNTTLEHGNEGKHLLPPSSYFDTLLCFDNKHLVLLFINK